MTLPRLAVVCDYREENWPSMDLVADMLVSHLQRDYAHLFDVTRICPPLRRRFTNQRAEARSQTSADESQQSSLGTKLFNADRLLNRFWDYPRLARGLSSQFDLFHLVDHSYGQLLHELPAARTVVTCHDLDTFQCLLNPEQDPRSFLFRKMMERTLAGFRRAARVTCDSAATRTELLAHGLVDPERAVVVPNGVHPSCSPEADPAADREAERLLSKPDERHGPDAFEVLHVGSTIPRKRIDVLLQIFAAVRKEFPAARLIRVGGPFTKEQERLVDALSLAGAIVVLPNLERNVLAAVYRRAAVVLQPSEREGFGLPVLEALACGAPVVASDLPALREVGGAAVEYCAVAVVGAWTQAVTQLLAHRNLEHGQANERRASGLAQAAKLSWAKYSRRMIDIYQSVLQAH
jgi:glycosyltransferase involved in cell wall biosynthesis